MGSGWSEEVQAPQSQSQPPPPPQVAAGNVTTLRSNELNAANSNQTSRDQEKSKAVKERAAAQVLKLPHGFESIVKEADSPVDRSSMDKLRDQLCAGIFLNKGTKKYWVEKKSNSNCFMLFPRALSITWSEESKYWKWNRLEEASNPIEVAELLNVCWLEVHGKIKTAELSPGMLYEIAFVIMIKDPSYGWEVPVNIRLSKPDGTKQEHKETLVEKPKGKWVEIPVGDFIVNRESSVSGSGEIQFSMFEYEGGMWKTGLLLRGVIIRPKN